MLVLYTEEMYHLGLLGNGNPQGNLRISTFEIDPFIEILMLSKPTSVGQISSYWHEWAALEFTEYMPELVNWIMVFLLWVCEECCSEHLGQDTCIVWGNYHVY